MNIAMAQTEIARFFEIPPQAVEDLWARKSLQRSIYVDHRQIDELSHSSIFDVLELYLRQSVLPMSASQSEVDAWMTAVDEFSHAEHSNGLAFEDLVFELMQLYLDFAGHPCKPDDLATRGTQVMTAYISLLASVNNTATRTAA